MKIALDRSGVPIEAAAGAPTQTLCPHCGGVVILRQRTGAVYQQRFGPDKKVGRVDLSDGRVYVSRLGPDTYVGQVHADGRMRLHQWLGVDDYIARVDEFLSYAHAVGALLLLVMPALEAEPASESPEEATTNSDSQS